MGLKKTFYVKECQTTLHCEPQTGRFEFQNQNPSRNYVMLNYVSVLPRREAFLCLSLEKFNSTFNL